MKPAHERSQECLPPKKRDLPLSRDGGDGGGGEGAHGTAPAPAPGEWPRVQPVAHYSAESSDGLGLTLDQYGTLYKVALPSAYPPSSPHPVLGHISPAYTVPPSLLHPGIPYPPLGYAPIPPSSVQFVGPPYALPYAVPPGFVPGPLVPPQPAVPPAHLVPYPSVIQGGVVSPPPQAKLSPRGAPVFFPRAAQDSRQVNGGGEEQRGVRDLPQDRPGHHFEARDSSTQRNIPDTDLKAQQVVARLASPNQVVPGSRKETSVGPLNLSQGAQREREALLAVRGEDVLAAGLSTPDDPERPAHHTVLLANGQPVLVPLDYRQQLRPAPPNDTAAASPPPPSRPPNGPEHSPATAAPPPGPSHFTRGAIIQLATGELKRVEDLRTQDFVRSAEASGGLKVDSSMVADIRRSRRPGLVALFFTVGEQQSRVAIDVPPEHPFFVFGQGWSSCSPDRSARLYGLNCHLLQAGDVCVSIALQPPPQPPPTQSKASAKAGSAPVPAFQPMGPPAPQHPRPSAQSRGERGPRDRDEEQPAPPRPDRTVAEHARSRSGYHLHREGPRGPGAPLPMPAAPRRWSAPGFQKYDIKSEEAVRPSPTPCPASSGSSRPSFLPQEVKVSIEGRSNAGK